LPSNRMALGSINEGSCVSMTWQAISVRPHHSFGCWRATRSGPRGGDSGGGGGGGGGGGELPPRL